MPCLAYYPNQQIIRFDVVLRYLSYFIFDFRRQVILRRQNLYHFMFLAVQPRDAVDSSVPVVLLCNKHFDVLFDSGLFRMDGALTTARLAAALSLRTFCARANRLRQAGRRCVALGAAVESREGAMAPLAVRMRLDLRYCRRIRTAGSLRWTQALLICSSSVPADEISHTPGEASTLTIATRPFSTSMAYRDDRP